MSRAKRESRWNFRVEPRSDSMVRDAAAFLGTTKTAFVEQSAVRRAETVLAERRRSTLESGEFSRFVAALEAPPSAVPGLTGLLSRPSPIPPP